MKISIGMTIQSGAWGGGNRFARALSGYFNGRGMEVSFDLTDPELDIILLAEPAKKLRISAYDHRDIVRYLLFRNPRCLVVHRINNTSEARDDVSKAFNRFRIQANQVADHTVFVSDWVRRMYQASGFPNRPNTLILNGADHRIWRPSTRQKPSKEKVSLVTHHWSNHPNKGFDIYKRLDQLLSQDEWKKKISFTYIGRLPEGFSFENVRHLEPISGRDLSKELANHDVYLTASRFESGGNHNLEGALCGLPLLYLNSGSMAEYCSGFGVEYSVDTFEEKLMLMLKSYRMLAERMPGFPHTADLMCQRYEKLFYEMIQNRDQIRSNRAWWKRPLWVGKTLYGKA